MTSFKFEMKGYRVNHHESDLGHLYVKSTLLVDIIIRAHSWKCFRGEQYTTFIFFQRYFNQEEENFYYYKRNNYFLGEFRERNLG